MTTPEHQRAALVTYKLTGKFTPGMVCMFGVPFPIEKVTVMETRGEALVVARASGGIIMVLPSQLRPVKLP